MRAGQKISLTILSEPDNPISATLDSIDPGLTTMSKGSYSKSTDTTSSAIYYFARAIVDNSNHKLAIGMTTQNTIEINSARNVLIVPNVAVKARDGKKYVRVLAAGNQVVEKEVQTGLKDSMNIEIKSGLAEGDKVVMSEMGAGEKAEAMQKSMGPGPR